MKKEYVWEVEREDAGHLGNPMGMEYTEPIETKFFRKKADAWEYLKKIAKRYGETLNKNEWCDYTFCQDIRCEIVTINRKRIY